MPPLEMVITAREKDLGEMTVRRILPYATHRMVGPFIFFDHMGPAHFQPGHGLDVRPHPHICLATVTYLFKGAIRHRDSLGSDQLIEPGAINWMTAGRGIVHSERTPDTLRATGHSLDGIQCWVALPDKDEETSPTFSHHPADTLPTFKIDGVDLKVLLGSAFDRQSPVPVHSDLFYVEAKMPKGTRITIPGSEREAAVYVVSGRVEAAGEQIASCHMGVGKDQEELPLTATEDSHLLLLGGKPLGKRYIFWNFVASSQDRLERARLEWARGPGQDSFPLVPGDDQDFIPLPGGVQNPKGTIL